MLLSRSTENIIILAGIFQLLWRNNTIGSKICNACFIFHYRILQQLNNESATEPESLAILLSNLIFF